MSSVKTYWRSVEEYGSREGSDPSHDGDGRDAFSAVGRRRFLALMAASVAAAGAGCKKAEDRGEIVPYLKQPEGAPPGTPLYYASCLLQRPSAPAVLVTMREGRPVKLEGNPDHPISRGALGAYGQAATLELYDPDRLRAPTHQGKAITWEDADAEITKALNHAARAGKRILLFTPALASPTARALVNEFKTSYPTTTHLPVEMFHGSEIVEGRKRAFGSSGVPHIDWERARVILSLDSDFLAESGQIEDQRGFISGRRPDRSPEEMNRLWAVEGGMSTTGSNADHRLRLRPGFQGKFVLWLLNEIAAHRKVGPLAGRPEILGALTSVSESLRVTDFGIDEAPARSLIRDLVEHRARSAILAGAHLPASLHVLVAALNASLENEGTVLRVPAGGADARAVASAQELARAAEEIESSAAAVFIDLQANPVFVLPPDLRLGANISKIPLVINSSLLPDETGGKAHYLLPCTHDLESWGDSDAHGGLLALQQPVIAPLFDARQCEDSLLRWLPPSPGRPKNYREYLRSRWRNEVYAQLPLEIDFESFWNISLHDGFITTAEEFLPPQDLRPKAVLEAIVECARPVPSGIDLVLTPSPRMFDGRFANNGWLQELPHPVTTQVWGNGAVMSRATAQRLQCKEGEAVRLTVEGRSLKVPALIGPGTADDLISIDLGYGRRIAGSVGSNVGVDAGTLRRNAGGLSPWFYTGAGAERTGESSKIIRVQTHFSIEGRPIIKEATLAGYLSHPELSAEAPEETQQHIIWPYKDYHWAMAVDLTACTGCGACSLACTAENNVPVVGPEQVSRKREMHWLRIDRYYSGPPDNPGAVYQPVFCQHCDAAPCEKVCPVAATVHSPEGLNEMVYNRCVGTRYCANNCPYKVRRFNFFNYHEQLVTPAELVYNPEVTVRSRGIIEKCTFCVQRISAAKHHAKLQGRKIRDGELLTACQQACPTGAIVFGDINDPQSRVSQLTKDRRGYRALGELGVRPSVTYLAKIRNPHSDTVA